MATTFKWDIIKLSCFPQYNQFSDVVFDVGWKYTGTDENGNSADVSNNTAIHFSPDTQFTPFSELTKDTVIGWIESTLTPDGVAALQNELNTYISRLASPQIVNPPPPWGYEQPSEPEPEPIAPLEILPQKG